MKLIATNKKAYRDYFIEETLECGINLIGCEVKSIRSGNVNMTDSYCEIRNGQLIMCGCYVKNYDKGSFSNASSRRDRRLLATKHETMRLLGKVREKGFTVVPLKIYFVGSLVKVEIALCRGKKLYDKRQTIARRDMDRAQDAAIKEALH